jgi:hypothetical protein
MKAVGPLGVLKFTVGLALNRRILSQFFDFSVAKGTVKRSSRKSRRDHPTGAEKGLNVYVYGYGTVSGMKTTVLLREDLYEILKKKYGPRGISEAINAILAEALLKGEGMFGTMARTPLKDIRDHSDRL